MLRRLSASVAYRLPVIASVARTEAIARFRVDHNALAVSEKALDCQFVAFGTQYIHCIGREAVFHLNYIREPLMMHPRSIDGFLNIEAEINYVHEHIGDVSNDGWTAFGAQYKKQFIVFENDSRRHGREWALARTDGVGGALNQSIGIGHTLLGGEVVHFVVEQKAEAAGGD